MAEHSHDTLFLLVCQVKYQIFMVLFLPAATCQGRENLLYYSLVITMIYICDNCRFLFSRAAEPEQCPDCGKRHTIFGESRIETVAEELEVPVLARLPIDPALAAAFDAGKIEDFPANYMAQLADRLDG